MQLTLEDRISIHYMQLTLVDRISDPSWLNWTLFSKAAPSVVLSHSFSHAMKSLRVEGRPSASRLVFPSWLSHSSHSRYQETKGGTLAIYSLASRASGMAAS